MPSSKYFKGISILKRGGRRDKEREAERGGERGGADKEGRMRSPFGGLGVSKAPLPTEQMLYLDVGHRNYGYNSSSDVVSTCSSNLTPRCRSPDRCDRQVEERSVIIVQHKVKYFFMSAHFHFTYFHRFFFPDLSGVTSIHYILKII